MVLVKTRVEGLSISIGREAVSIHSSSAIGKYQSFKKPEFYDLFKITLLVITYIGLNKL